VPPSEYGYITALLIAVELGRTLIDLGFDNFAVRHFDGSTQKSRTEAKVCFQYKCAISTVLSLIAIAAIPTIFELRGNLYIAMPLLLPAVTLNAYSFACLQSRQSLSIDFTYKVATISIAVLALSALSITVNKPLMLVTSVILGEFAILTLCITRLGYLSRENSGEEFLPVLKRVIKHSYPLAVSALISTIYQRFDVFLLGTLGAAVVGTYALVSRSAEPILLISGALSTAAFAFLSKLNKSSNRTGNHDTSRNALLAVYLLASISVSALFASGWAFALPLLPQYEASGMFIMPVTLALAVRIFNQGCVTLMMAASRFHTIMHLTIINFFVAAICSILLLRTGGAVGCAWGLTVSELINTILLMHLLFKSSNSEYA